MKTVIEPGNQVRHKPVQIFLSLALLLLTASALAPLAAAQEVLTNDAVIKMAKAGLGETLIVDMIRTKPGKYTTTTDDVLKLKQAGVSENEIAAMMAKGSAESNGGAPGGSANEQSEVSPPSQTTFTTPSGMTITQDDVAYDGSTFKVTSMNGTPRSVMEMKPGGQPVMSSIMPNGRIVTYPSGGDASYPDRIRAVLKIHAEGHAEAAAAAAPQNSSGGSAGMPPHSGAAPPAAASGGSSAGARSNLDNYEGSLGSLGKAQILLPGTSIETRDGTLKNEGDSSRLIVYFSDTREKVSFSSSKSSDHKDDVVVLAGHFGASRMSAYAASTLGGGQPTSQYTEYLIHFTGGNSNVKHMFLGTFKSQTLDRAKPGSSALGTNSTAHTASFTISTIDSNGHVHEALSSRQIDDWMNTSSFSRGLGVDPGAARAAGLVVVADQALVDHGKENPDLRQVKKEYGIGEALKNDMRLFAFGAGRLDKPGEQEKRDSRIGATAGALGTTSSQ